MSGKERRPRLRHVHLATINVALDHYIRFLKDQLAKHEDDPHRFDEQDRWLRKREELNWLLTNAKRARVRIGWNLKGTEGRMPEPVRELLNLRAEDKPGEYIPFIEAMKLLPYHDFDKDSRTLFTAVERGGVHGFRDPLEDGLLMVRKRDVQRYAAWLEVRK